MTESHDMDAPVTRRELHETLDLWGGAFEQRMERRIDSILAAVKGLFEAQDVRLANMEARLGSVETGIVVMETRLINEIKGQTKGSEEELASRLVAVDEQYKDLPSRVTRLEAKVFPPKKPRRRRAS